MNQTDLDNLADVIWYIKGRNENADNPAPFTNEHVESLRKARLMGKEHLDHPASDKKETEWTIDRLAETLINQIQYNLMGREALPGCRPARHDCPGCAYEKLKPQDSKRHETCLVCRRNYTDHFAVRIIG